MGGASNLVRFFKLEGLYEGAVFELFKRQANG